MALRSPSSTPPRDLGSRDSPPADSPTPTSQVGSSNGAKAVGRKTNEEVDHLLAKLEKEGLEIDDKIASIVDAGIVRIKAEAMRENINKPKRDGMKSLLSFIGCMAIGFVLGTDFYIKALLARDAKEQRALDEKLAKRRRA